MTKGYPALSFKDALKIGSLVEDYGNNALGNKPGQFQDSVFQNLVKVRNPLVEFDTQLLDSTLVDFKEARLGIIQGAGKTSNTSKTEQREAFAETALKLVDCMPIEALQDLDFWRYLAVFRLRDYIVAVEGDFLPQRYGGSGNKVVNRWTLIRELIMGLRAVVGNDYAYLSKVRSAKEAAGLGSGVLDLYISQIVRRKCMSAHGAGKAYIDAVLLDPPLFDKGKEFRPTQALGASIGRASENIYLPALDGDNLLTLFLELKEKVSAVHDQH